MNKKQKLTILFFLIIFSLYSYISWINSIVILSLSIFFYSVILYFLISPFKKIKNKEYKIFNFINYKLFLDVFLYKVSILILSLIIIIWWFSYYQNEVAPASMPIYYLTNWDKKIVFQSMSHIWSENFYNDVVKNITNFKKNWYVLYYEWVKPWSEESHEKFDKALWIKLDQKTYENMSKLYGLVNQDNTQFLGLINNLDYNIDISIDEIVKYYDDLKIKNNNQNRIYKEPLNASEIIINKLASLRENELKVLIYINKSFMNLIIKSDWLKNTIQKEFTNKDLFDIILNKRNEVIADKIILWEDKNIIITYGLLHFNWVFELLKQNDIKWKIEKIDYLYPIK